MTMSACFEMFSEITLLST